MLKSFIFGFLIGVIVCGAGWFVIGRNDLREIRSDYNTASGDLERVQRDLSKLGTYSDGFARDIVEVTEGIKSSRERVGLSNERLIESNSIIGEQLIKVDQLEKWNRRSIVLGRDFGDQLFYLRQLNKESGIQE